MQPSSASMIYWVRSRPDDAVKVMDIDRLFAAGAPRAVLAGRLRYGDGYAFTLCPEVSEGLHGLLHTIASWLHEPANRLLANLSRAL